MPGRPLLHIPRPLRLCLFLSKKGGANDFVFFCQKKAFDKVDAERIFLEKKAGKRRWGWVSPATESNAFFYFIKNALDKGI
jgi:hypothetical protein